MKWNNVWRGWWLRSVTGHQAWPDVRRRLSRRFRLEQLEDRYVPANFTAASVPDLIADIRAANQTVESDTITLVAGRTFTLNAADNTTDGVTGLPMIAPTENLTILGSGDTIERSSATGTPVFRLFDVASGASLTLANLTLQGGAASMRTVPGPGGGLVFVPAQGGAIYNQGTLSLDSTTIRNNAAQGSSLADLGYYTPGGDAQGGGLWSSGVLTLHGCNILNNTAVGSCGADGAAYYNGNPDPGSHPPQPGLHGGSALGGGVYVAAGTAMITGTAIQANTAQGGAGGRGQRGAANGDPGQGLGGGLYIAPPASVGLDAFTLNHFRRNRASTSDRDIAGSYSVIP